MRDVHVLPTLPSVSKLIAKGMLGMINSPSPAKGLPDRSAMVMDHKQDIEQAAAYAKVCGFSVGSYVPATWLHVLTFPLQTHLMAEKDFPFALAGLVHVSNEMTLHRPVAVTEKLRLAVEATNLAPHKRGATFDLVGTIHVGDELVWEGSSNYLAAKAKVPGDAPKPERLAAPEVPPSQKWKIPADLGKQYAKVSGDSNPIHISGIAARAFGMPRPIIHGMWTHARALAAFGGALPSSYSVKVQFTKPIPLPSTVFFAADRDGDATRFAVTGRDEKPRLVGQLR